MKSKDYDEGMNLLGFNMEPGIFRMSDWTYPDVRLIGNEAVAWHALIAYSRYCDRFARPDLWRRLCDGIFDSFDNRSFLYKAIEELGRHAQHPHE